jgi:adenine-specific DNA-methyltransferase
LGLDDVLIVDGNIAKKEHLELKSLLPLIRAQDCLRYSYVSPKKYVIYPYREIDGETVIIDEIELNKKFPTTYKYLLSNKSKLNMRKDSRKAVSENKNWYSLIRFGQLSMFNKPKIVTPGEVKNSKFAIDESNSGYSGARVYGIVCENDKVNLNVLLGFLNSKLIQFYMHSVAPLKQGGYYSYSSTFIETIPLPNEIDNLSNSSIIKINEIVSNVLALNRNLSSTNAAHEKSIIQRQIDSAEKRIDELVYELYGLSNAEINIIEENHS